MPDNGRNGSGDELSGSGGELRAELEMGLEQSRMVAGAA